MSMKQSQVADLCAKALERIDEAIAKHEKGVDADLSIPVLRKVRREVELMQSTLDPSVYQPGYARFILDSWPDKYGLVSFLVSLSYEYGRIRR